MPFYVFYPQLQSDLSLTFEAFELESDAQARETALEVLERHETCATVAVWEGERQVFELSREQAKACSASEQ